MDSNIKLKDKNYFQYILYFSIIVFLIFQFVKRNYAPDDTFIYLQYARNLAHGNGLSFNAGEPSYGITSPLWAVILSLPYFLSLDGFWFAKFLDLGLSLLSILVFYKFAGLVLSQKQTDVRMISGMQSVATAIFVWNTWFIRWSFTGMETSMAVFFVLAVFLFFFTERYVFAYLLMGLFYMIRPESAVLFCLLTLFLIVNKIPLKKTAAALPVYIFLVGSFLLFSKYYFGTVFPNTAIGKTSFNFGLSAYYLQIKRIIETISLSSILEMFLAAFSIIYFLRRKKLNKIELSIIFWIIFLITLYVVTDSDIISRYLLIIIPFITILAIGSFFAIKRNLNLIILIFTGIVFLQSVFLFFYVVKPHTDNFSNGMQDCFKYIGKWCSENTSKDSKIILGDVGTMGYFSGRYIIDAQALINRDLLLNKKIMATPLSEREKMTNVLKFVPADYLVQRDSIIDPYSNKLIGDYKLEFLFNREFPGLGITDNTPKYYNVYHILKENR